MNELIDKIEGRLAEIDNFIGGIMLEKKAINILLHIIKDVHDKKCKNQDEKERFFSIMLNDGDFEYFKEHPNSFDLSECNFKTLKEKK
jgi:hypothetical protein